jgi:hypothetical protein
MQHAQEPTEPGYPHGRGYGHDYMRGGEVLGGYGYSARAEYETPRGELLTTGEHERGPSDELNNAMGSPTPPHHDCGARVSRRRPTVS